MSYTVIHDDDCLQVRATIASQAEMMIFITALQKRAHELPETIGETDGRPSTVSPGAVSDCQQSARRVIDSSGAKYYAAPSPESTYAPTNQAPAEDQFEPCGKASINYPQAGDA